MTVRTIEDRLREEYFAFLPEIRRVAEQLESEIRHCLLPISLKLDQFERVVVKSRVKECDSALEALRRRQEGSTFDRAMAASYTLTDLKDLAGVRVLVFPGRRMERIRDALVRQYPTWTSDPVAGFDDKDEPLALKYFGYCSASDKVRGEFQVVAMLVGLFLDVEHSAIYKPTPHLRGVVRSLEMRERTQEVVNALRRFEEEFDSLVARSRKE